MSESLPEQVVLPAVSLILPCDNAVYDLGLNTWQLHGPWQPYRILAPEHSFPFRQAEVWVYAQLMGGVGSMSVAIDFRQKQDVDSGRQSFRTIGTSAAALMEFEPNQNRLLVLDTAFEFKHLPFRSEGTYEFRVLADTPTGWRPLNGPVFEFTILDSRGRI
jgi:hypothetical protein